MHGSANDILNYLFEKYYEQLIPIIMAEDAILYFNIVVE